MAESPMQHLACWKKKKGESISRLLQIHTHILEEKIKEEWLKIPTIEIQNLISSMPSRVAAVITAKGSHTKY